MAKIGAPVAAHSKEQSHARGPVMLEEGFSRGVGTGALVAGSGQAHLGHHSHNTPRQSFVEAQGKDPHVELA